MATSTASLGRETRVLTLISTGHFMSHYSQIAIYPLFLLIHEDLGFSYAALGLIVTLLNASGAVTQVPIGFLVDRFGARALLIGGLFTKTFAIGALALTSSYEVMLVLAVIAGLGNAVFHPADYSILMSTINESRIGRAFSIHTAAGSAGSLIAPSAVVAIGVAWGWRPALLSVALIGLIAGIGMILQARVLSDHIGPKQTNKQSAGVVEGLRMLLAPQVLILYLFFMITAMISIGFNSFTVAALANLHQTPLIHASWALTSFLGAGLVGVLLGGYLADKTTRHDLIASGAFVVSAIAVMIIGAYELPILATLFFYAVIGLFLGTIRPARDMMVRDVTRDGDAGKMFGFMSTGHLVGGIIVPVLFGWIIDQGQPQWIFWLTAIFMGIALLSLFSRAGKTGA